jgi:hypothetical protein
MLNLHDVEIISSALHRFRGTTTEVNLVDALSDIAMGISEHATAMHRIADALEDDMGRGIAQAVAFDLSEISRAAQTMAGAQQLRAGL